MNRRTLSIAVLLLLILVSATACNIPGADDEAKTQTFEAAFDIALTQTAQLAPVLSPIPTLTSPPALISTATSSGANIVTATSAPGSTSVIVVTSPPQADAVVAVTNLRLRTGPHTNFPVIKQMPEGASIQVTGKNANLPADSEQLWLRVVTLDGQLGWAAGWLLTINVDVSSVPVVATPVPPTSVPTHTPAPTGPAINLWADSTELWPGNCTTVHWNVENIQAVFFEGTPAVGQGEQQVCPSNTTTYTLTVSHRDGTTTYSTVTVNVANTPSINFRADSTQLNAGECTTIRWDVEGVKAVHFQGIGVIGHDTESVCPSTTTTYKLEVTGTDDKSYEHSITINVQ